VETAKPRRDRRSASSFRLLVDAAEIEAPELPQIFFHFSPCRFNIALLDKLQQTPSGWRDHAVRRWSNQRNHLFHDIYKGVGDHHEHGIARRCRHDTMEFQVRAGAAGNVVGLDRRLAFVDIRLERLEILGGAPFAGQARKRNADNDAGFGQVLRSDPLAYDPSRDSLDVFAWYVRKSRDALPVRLAMMAILAGAVAMMGDD